MPPAHLYLMGYIYKITNRINGCMYIGQTTRTPEYRWEQHKRNAWYEYKEAYHSKFYRAIRKYGTENFDLGVIEECDNDNLNDREIYWIRYYNTFNTSHGYNCTSGGGSCYVMSDETREKISAAKSGVRNHYYGKHLSEGHRKKIGDAQRGEKANMYGKHHTELQKRQVKLAESRPIVAFTQDGDVYMYFFSSMAASRSFQYHAGSISKCIRGISKSAGKTISGDKLLWRNATTEEANIITYIFLLYNKEVVTPEEYCMYSKEVSNGNWNQNL